MRKTQALTARNKMMDFLARRDHSERELKQKLRQYDFSPEEIDRALTFAKEKGWLPATEDGDLVLSKKMAQGLHRRNKGILYINHYLEKKGLPALKAEPELEIEKAVQCLQNKRRTDKQKQMRFLLSRGFQMEVIRKVVK